MRYLIIVVSSILLLGCDVETSKIDDENAKEIIDSIKYVKDNRSGLCFAMVATSATLAKMSDVGLSFTDVPCDKVYHLLEE